ncbi:hypothetical protein RSOLAG22IIIB_06592 [Rhizoctonia solani]|uniref:Uncharacterized protein n=1 Tax=Rhizoctonia solani TaxID=456999 RepID=A0A0K6GFJ6_9AGAM|nr:hypothetical protein RSOLAG22IIIB_06592 [Rhizoctonia solani]
MADAPLPGDQDPTASEPGVPPEQLVAPPEMNFEHDQPTNAPVQELNNVAGLNEDLAPIPGHLHPNNFSTPLLKSFQGPLSSDE